MDKEKFVQRVNMMLYETCGCNKEEAIEVLKECLKMAKAQKDFQKNISGKRILKHRNQEINDKIECSKGRIC